jgi:hypothetical protein
MRLVGSSPMAVDVVLGLSVIGIGIVLNREYRPLHWQPLDAAGGC